MPIDDRLRRFLLPTLIALLVACWLGGGVTEDSTATDEWLQLMSLPVMLLAIAVLSLDGAGDRLQRAAIGVAGVVVLLPALQLLPLPVGLWHAPAARQALAADLTQVGIAGMHLHWSLSPSATERSLWSLLPAFAAFLASIALPAPARRRTLQAMILLVLSNVVFAFFQAGLPRDSPLRLYRDFNAGFGGLLANTNHQATACIIGMVLAIGLAVHARMRARHRETPRHAHWWYGGLAVFFLLVVPLSTSRAGMAIALPALGLTLLLTGALDAARIRRSKRVAAAALGAVVCAVVGMRVAMGWMAIDKVAELRHVVAGAALAIGKAQAPFGSGIGSFVRVFEQGGPASLWSDAYINHAHNEYIQWWMTAGWIGMAGVATVLAVLCAAGWRVVRLRGANGDAIHAGACLSSLCVVAAHSWVDYPLRTTTLMVTTAALAGLMFASLADAAGRGRRAQLRNRDLGAREPA